MSLGKLQLDKVISESQKQERILHQFISFQSISTSDENNSEALDPKERSSIKTI